MGSDTTANIILRLKDEFSKNLQSAGKNFDSFARSVDQMGTAISRTGMKMVAIGTTMNAPFFAAAKAMEKYSFDAQQQMQRLNAEVLALSKVISDAAMPTIKTFNDNFSKTINVLKSLDPVLLQNIAHWSMSIGQILIAVGVFEIFVGKTLSLIGKMASGWLGKINLIIGAIALLTYAWTQHHDAFMKVLNAIDIGFNSFVIANLAGYKAMVEGLVTLSKVFPPMAGMTQPLQDGLDSINKALAAFKQNVIDAQNGNGAFARGVNNSVASLTQGVGKIKAAADKAKKDIEEPMKDLKTRFKELSFSMADDFSSAFDQIIFEGKGFADTMKNVFENLARGILKDFTSTALRTAFNSLFNFGKMTPEQKGGSGIGGLAAAGLGIGSIFGPIGSAIGGIFGSLLKFHEGGVIPIYAHSGLAPDEVPIIAQRGEGVLSRKGMAALGGSDKLRALNSGKGAGGGGQTVNYAPIMVIQAWDSSDVYRNRKILSAAIQEDIKNNGLMRQVINQYR